jgi:dienelactone hydrolase
MPRARISVSMPSPRRSVALLAALLLAGAGPAAAQGASARPASPTALDSLLAYDARAPLGLRVVGTETQGGVTVQDVVFASVAGGAPTQAYVVRPDGAAGPLAAVLFVHWFAPPEPTSNRTQYLDEARALARRGVVSLLVSTFWSEQARYRARRWQDDFRNSVAQARELRRALDVLQAQPGVDPARIAYVGHDYGAMFGSVVAGVDTRPRAYVLIAGAPRFPDWYLFGSASGRPAGADLAAFREEFARIDPVGVLGRSRAAVFLQYGEEDRFTPRDAFLELYRAAPEPKRIATYRSGHAMDAPIIRLDRTAWMAEQLGLPER